MRCQASMNSFRGKAPRAGELPQAGAGAEESSMAPRPRRAAPPPEVKQEGGSSGRPRSAAPREKGAQEREWNVEWKPAPTANGRERMGRAVQLLLDATRGADGRPREPPAEASELQVPTSLSRVTREELHRVEDEVVATWTRHDLANCLSCHQVSDARQNLGGCRLSGSACPECRDPCQSSGGDCQVQ